MVNNDDLNALLVEATAVADSKHFLDCRTCGEPFDMRDLDQVIAHEHDGPHEVTGIVGERVG